MEPNWHHYIHIWRMSGDVFISQSWVDIENGMKAARPDAFIIKDSQMRINTTDPQELFVQIAGALLKVANGEKND